MHLRFTGIWAANRRRVGESAKSSAIRERPQTRERDAPVRSAPRTPGARPKLPTREGGRPNPGIRSSALDPRVKSDVGSPPGSGVLLLAPALALGRPQLAPGEQPSDGGRSHVAPLALLGPTVYPANHH